MRVLHIRDNFSTDHAILYDNKRVTANKTKQSRRILRAGFERECRPVTAHKGWSQTEQAQWSSADETDTGQRCVDR